MGSNIIVKGSNQPQVIRVDGPVPVKEIKMEVTELNRGPQGIPGPAGKDGKDGAIQYTAGFGININASNVISATGTTTAAWGTITGTMSQQADLNSALTNLDTAVNAKAAATDLGNLNSLTTTAKTSAVAAINEVNNNARFNIDYSTTEVDTGARWVNDKKIYKTTYYISALPNATSATYDPGITNVDFVIKVEGIATRPSDHATFPLPFAYPTAANCISLTYIKNTGLIQIGTGQDRSTMDAYVTIYYTKTS